MKAFILVLLICNVSVFAQPHPHYALENDLNGSIATVPGNHLRFIYLENYLPAAGQFLNYEVYDENFDLLFNPTTQPLSISVGTNQFSINVSQMTVGEVGLLKVFGMKGEKYYLRFRRTGTIID